MGLGVIYWKWALGLCLCHLGVRMLPTRVPFLLLSLFPGF